jgi:hypothetical protein
VQHCRKDNVLGSASEAKHLRTLVKTSTIQVDASGASIYLNVLQLGEVAEIEAQMFSFAQKFNRRTVVEFSTEPAILPNCCYLLAFLLVIV